MEAIVDVSEAAAWSSAGQGTQARTGVALVHGFTADPSGVGPLARALAADGFAVEVPCLPGHGTRVRDLGATRYADWVGAVDQVVDHLRATSDRVVLVGHSLGGTLSLDVASRRVADVDGVVVINPQVSDPTQPLAKLAPMLQYVLPYVPRDLAGLPTNDVADPDVRERAYGWVPARAARSLIVQLRRIRRQLLDLEQPLLVVWSPDDHTVPASNARELVQLVGTPDVRELVCRRSYHVPQLDHDRDRVVAAVREFVAEVHTRQEART